MVKDIEKQIEDLYGKNYTIKIISRIIHKKTTYVSDYIKRKKLNRRHILKKPPLFCINCGKEIKRRDAYKYCSRKCMSEYKIKTSIKNWLSGDVICDKEEVPNYIRKYLFEINDNKCSKCGWGKINQTTKKIPLTINHIDGNYLNNKPENLELICPNCHSLTPNYGSLNKGNGRKKRLEKIRDSGPCRT